MNLWNRFKSWFKSEAHSALDSLESTPKMIDQSLRDAKEKIDKTVKSTALAVAHVKSVERKIESEKENVKAWNAKAEKAVLSGDDELAKNAIQKKLAHESNLATYEKMYIPSKKSADKLKSIMEKQQNEYELLKIQSDNLKSQSAFAQTMKDINKSALGIDDDGFINFNNLQESINKQQDEASAYEELANESTAIEDKFEALESPKLDEELEKMKAKLGVGNKDKTPLGEKTTGAKSKTVTTKKVKSFRRE